MQQGVQTDAHVTSKNVGSCWPTMLRSFARGLTLTWITEKELKREIKYKRDEFR